LRGTKLFTHFVFGGTPQMKAHWDTWSKAMEAHGHVPERKRFRVCRDVFIADSDLEAKRRYLRSVWHSVAQIS